MEKCRCCGSSELKILIDFGIQPVAHNLLKSKEEEDRYMHPLCLHYCENCGFIQINEPIPPENLYTEYNFCFSGWKHQPQISDEIELISKYVVNKEIKILEIGCNDGVFLKPLVKAGFKKIVGIEANPYAAKEAEIEGVNIINEMFDSNLAINIKKEYGEFDIVILRHVLEHIPDLQDFFKSMDLLLGEKKLLFIEVPNFAEALKYRDCSTIWEEHPNYFTFETMIALLNRRGYSVVDSKLYDFSGGSMCVLVRKEEKRGKLEINNDKSYLPVYEQFSHNVQMYALKLRKVLKTLKEKDYEIYLYGTGARACTLVNGLGIEEIDCAIDDQEEKQGYYMPGCRLKIKALNNILTSNEKKVFLLAVNHENEAKVSKKIKNIYGDNVYIISLFAPNDIFNELTHIEMI